VNPRQDNHDAGGSTDLCATAKTVHPSISDVKCSQCGRGVPPFSREESLNSMVRYRSESSADHYTRILARRQKSRVPSSPEP
jgi:hypothetical protein